MMHAALGTPKTSTLIWSAVMTLPLLMPGARRRYGTIPVVLGLFALGKQVYGWAQARRRHMPHELAAARLPAHQ
jgi:hypothetical protein